MGSQAKGSEGFISREYKAPLGYKAHCQHLSPGTGCLERAHRFFFYHDLDSFSKESHLNQEQGSVHSQALQSQQLTSSQTSTSVLQAAGCPSPLPAPCNWVSSLQVSQMSSFPLINSRCSPELCISLPPNPSGVSGAEKALLDRRGFGRLPKQEERRGPH